MRNQICIDILTYKPASYKFVF